MLIKKAKPNTFKLTIVGEAGVGKSSILQRIIFNRFAHPHPSTIGAAFTSYEHNNVKYQIWDTAGQERFQALLPLYIRDSKIVFIVYDTTNLISINKIDDHWIDFVIDNTDDAHLILIGNKIDIPSNNHIIQTANNIARRYNISHFTVSAKTGENATSLFEDCDKHIAEFKLNLLLKTTPDDTIKISEKYWNESTSTHHPHYSHNNDACSENRCNIL